MARGKAQAQTAPELGENAQAVRDAFIGTDVIEALADQAGLEREQVIDALSELNDFGDKVRAELVTHGDAEQYELDEPAEGYGHVVIEAPLDVVEAMAALHPSEHASMAAMASGRLREALIETGRHRSRRPRGSDPLPAASVAIVAGRLV